MKKVDTEKKIGVAGWWFASNYGSVLTYYSLCKTIEKLGYEPVLIDCPIEKDVPGISKTFARDFIESRLQVSKYFKWEEVGKNNDECDTFLVGSDQVWTMGSIKTMKGYFFFLDFVSDDKKKIAYGISFGHSDFSGDDEVLAKVRYHAGRFDHVSVREDVGVDVCKNIFGIDAVQVPDPVFFLGKRAYDAIAKESTAETDHKYVLSYILDPADDKKKIITEVSERLSLPLINLLDGRVGTFESNKKKLGLSDIKENVSQQDWIKYIKNAEYVVTDSHHGAAMAIIYNKPFICYANPGRGQVRFDSLFKKLDLNERMVFSHKEYAEKDLLNKNIDYDKVNAIIKREKAKGERWLSKALSSKKVITAKSKADVSPAQGVTSVPAKSQNRESLLEKDPDFRRCKTLVSMLRDYGVKHVVLSSGTRNMNLVRLFEANDSFTTYNILDERSAVFYAIGISLKLDECVAVCCTSGTAASNYLTGITEAFYQKVPIIAITADRYPCLLGQMEDQTIPQSGMYKGVCKKSVTLPVSDDFLSVWETRRLISDALLEARRDGDGPVHINVPVNTIVRKLPDPEDLMLYDHIRKIERIELFDDPVIWERYADRLKEYKKILVVFGQSKVPEKSLKEDLIKFLEKYDCTLIRDHLSNIHDVGVMSFPILKAMSQEEFNRDLSPDLIITFGGMRMLNDPITYRLRWAKEPVEHWHVSPDGEIADKFRKMTAVFHCDTRQFLDRFISSAGKGAKDGNYLSCWKREYEKRKEPVPPEYCQKYTIQRIISSIPGGSMLHIGIGNTIMYANLFELNEDVEVFCNMGTNGIDGSSSTFMGHVAVSNKPAFLLIGDLSFFYDMNSVFNKELKGNLRVFMTNNDGAGLLRDLHSPAITHEHHKVAKAYVESLGFRYLYAASKKDFDEKIKIFTDMTIDEPVFFEVFT